MHAPPLPITIDFDPASLPDFTSIPNTRGVAIFESADHRPVLIVSAARLRDAVLRRLEPQRDGEPSTRRADLRPIVKHVRASPVGSTFEGDLLFLRLAHDAMPETFRAVMDRKRAWFLHIDPDADFPKFTVIPTSAMPASLPPGGHLLGPVADKHAAQRLNQTLEDIFDLCRFHHILVKSPNATACAYKELGKCPAPCDGSEPLDSYRSRVHAAIEFMRDPATLLTSINAEMQRASEATDFERASALKSRLEAAQSITHHRTRHAIGDSRTGWCVMTTSIQTQSVRHFVIGPRGFREPETRDPEAIAHASREVSGESPDTELHAAIVGLACDALYRAPRRNERIIPLGAPDLHQRISAAEQTLSQSTPPTNDDPDDFEAEFTAEPME
ncbi:MAG: UvrB/UvrC motif-containing protein [Phycisphaerales bacterium]|nr:UvrB/UvrC motif-containing protein [Phycisphaerales bacterium]